VAEPRNHHRHCPRRDRGGHRFPRDPSLQDSAGGGAPIYRVDSFTDTLAVLGSVPRRARTSLPEPPWVWGPTEVNRWIRDAYPSMRRPRKSKREGPERIKRLRIHIDDPNTDMITKRLGEALRSIGVAVNPSTLPLASAKVERHTAIARVHQTVTGRRIHVSVRFSPPIHRSSCEQVLSLLSRRFRLVRVSAREERSRLPANRQ